MSTSNLEKLIPSKTKHSVSEVIFTLILANPIVNTKDFNDLLKDGSALHGKFQNFKNNPSINVKFKVEANSSDLQPQISQNGDDMFSIEAFKDGKLSWLIRYLSSNINPSLMNALSIHNLDYENWHDFFEENFAYMKAIGNVEQGIFVNSYGLTYIDQFNWTEAKLPTMQSIFNDESKYLPKLLFETEGVWSFTATHTRKVDENMVNEYTNVGITQIAENNFNIYLLHQSSSNFITPQKLKELCVDKDNLKKITTKMHNLNKEFLLQTLTDEICDKINLK